MRDAVLVDREHEIPLTTSLNHVADRYEGVVISGPRVSAQLSEGHEKAVQGAARCLPWDTVACRNVLVYWRSGSLNCRVAATL